MAEGYTVLIIGCGAIAGGFDSGKPEDADPLTHAGAYRRHGGFRLKACVEPDAARRESFARCWAVKRSYADVPAAVAAGTYDVVSICSPIVLHADHMMAAIGMRPKLIFCEKPVTPALETTNRLVSVCEQANILLAVNHTRRWAPDTVKLRDELSVGAWGSVRAAHGIYNKGVLNNGSHMLDLLQFLLGPLKLVAAGRPVHDFSDDDPSVPALLETRDGAIPVTLGIGHASDYAVFELSLITAEGVIVIEDGGQKWRQRRPVDSPKFPGYKALDRGEWHLGAYDKAMLAAVSEIHNVLAHGGVLSSTGRTAAAAQQLCAAIKSGAGTAGEARK